MGDYLPIVALGVLAVVFVFVSLLVSRLLGPSRATVPKSTFYECGITDTIEPPERFPVRFYLVAMLFIMFDIEIIFLYPWAVANADLGLFGMVAMLVFAGVFFLSFVYELAMGGLNWGPARRRVIPARSPERTTTSTVRKVGLEGREPVAATAGDEAA
jgi:NADH-quinone oxidoreductase subunit A